MQVDKVIQRLLKLNPGDNLEIGLKIRLRLNNKSIGLVYGKVPIMSITGGKEPLLETEITVSTDVETEIS